METTQTVASETTDSSLKEFFVEQLQDLMWAERKQKEMLYQFVDSCNSDSLRQAFTDHVEETQSHIDRLKDVFELLDENPSEQKSSAVSGIAEECDEIIDKTVTGTAQRDVAIIFAAQKAEHYEIATYGGLVSLARTLGYSKAAQILELTLSEEKNADLRLSVIAENHINYKASKESANL